MKEFFFNKDERNVPSDSIPGVKIDIHSLDPAENVVIWFGHSSFYMQLDGKKFLVDPVFSGAASPLAFTTRSFPGADRYTVDDIPNVDFLLITHDHWDHLDYETILKLKGKVGTIITGLGTAEHLEYWGYNPSIITEKDWYDEVKLDGGFAITIAPARHFSGRGFTRNRALWVSFVVKGPAHRVYVGGDSGYDDHFKKIGDEHGPFDLALLECGQYNAYWKYIHMMPEETAQAAVDLRAKRLMPVHWSKFALALHSWDEPILKVTAAAEKLNIPVVHPLIGEKVSLDSTGVFKKWWKEESEVVAIR
jgi:L-ascorbate metabolism protein UlaG (beta-lactamase superfamily)